jgi:hypothetical protein
MLFVDPLQLTEQPTEHELKTLRERVDPEGFIIGRG